MDRPHGPLLVALLVALASITVAAGGGPATEPLAAPAPSDADVAGGAGGAAANETDATVRRLSVGNGTVVEAFVTPDADMGAAVSYGDREFRSQMLGYVALQRLAAAENESERHRVVQNTLDDAQAAVEELRDAESAAVRAFHAGDIGVEELARRFGRIDAQAGSLQRSIEYLKERGQADNAFTFQLRQRVLWIKRDLGTFKTQIRQRIDRMVRASPERTRVHVVATADGFALETIENGVYVRDAVRFDNYEPNEAPTVGPDDVVQLATERYPSLKLSPDEPRRSGSLALEPTIGQRLWQLRLQYRQGTSTVFFDQSTGEVYREVHRLELDELPTRTVAETAENRLRVVVNGTDKGNPYRVSVVDATTGEPVEATVSVAGERVGTTGDDGVLWTLGTRQGFTVSAETGLQTVNVTVPG